MRGECRERGGFSTDFRGRLAAISGHLKDLQANIASRGKRVADIEHGYISATTCTLSNLSTKLACSSAWDPVAGWIVRDDEPDPLLQRPYRGPWVHPDPGAV